MTDTAKPIGEFLPALAAGETASPAPSTASTLASPSAALEFLAGLPDRIGDADLAKVDDIASAALAPLHPASPEHFASCLRSLSILPRRADDDCTGEQRIRLYARMLGDQPAEAMSYLTRTALGRCQWFPTIAECLEIVGGWMRSGEDVIARSRAMAAASRERQARFDETLAALKARSLSQAEIDALPDRTKRIAADKGWLWAWPDGRFTVRPDITLMTEDQAAAERQANAEMFAHWDALTSARAA